MNWLNASLTLFVIISSIGIVGYAFGTSHNIPPLSVITDSNTYDQGDTIVVTGFVKKIEEGKSITLRILDPNSKLVGIGQFNPASDGSFSFTQAATGPLWKLAGNYTIVIQYGSAQQADAIFSFSGGDGGTVINPADKKIFTIDAGSQGTFDVEYIIKGGTVKDMKINYEELSLSIDIDATKDGSITVTLPRDLIGATDPPELTEDDKLLGKTVDPRSGDDIEYIVRIDGAEVTPKETKDKDSRTLSIPFFEGDKSIVITGTYVVPEFGAIAAVVLAIAIISIIAVSAKTRLMPKY